MPAYAVGYDHDVFVSYARVDDNPVQGIAVGWVSQLVDTLENILAQEVGRSDKFGIWMDVKERVRMTPEILRRVERSAIFLMILSPGFLQSTWCRDELGCFMKTLGSRSDDGLTRIFIVEKTSRGVRRPPQLDDRVSYRLWYKDRHGRIRTRGLPLFRPEDIDYYNTIQDIAVDIIDELDRLNGGSHAS